jgi:4-amino-4-deoxy-L-arabinose transferase-like glycosyltransferase
MSGELRSRVQSQLGPLHDELTNRIADVDRITATAGVTVLLAAALRLYRLGHESLWLDETLSIDYVTREYTTLGLLFELPAEDPHPPLYYLLLDGWVFVFGTSEVAVRLLSAIFGIVAVGLIYAVGAKLFDREAGIVAAALLGLSSFNLYYAQEARMYTLLAALTLASFYLFVDVVEPDREADRRTVAAYVVVTALMGYTHVFGFFVIMAQNLYAFPRLFFAGNQWPDLDRLGIRAAGLSVPRWIGIQAATATLLAPWMFLLLRRVFAISGGSSSPISWIPVPELGDVPRAVHAFFFFRGAEDPLGMLPSPVGDVEIGFTVWLVLGLAAVAVIVRSDDGRLRLGPAPGVLTFVVLFLTPLIGAYLVSVHVTPIFVERYTICASLGLFLLVGAGVSALRGIDPFDHLRVGPNQVLPLEGRHLVVGLVVFALILPLGTYYGADQKEQWREAAAEVEASASPGAAVMITDNYMVSPYRYYADRSDLSVIPIDDATLGNEIVERLDGHDEVWVLHSHAESGAVVGYLERSYTDFRLVESSEHRFNGIRMYKFVRSEE